MRDEESILFRSFVVMALAQAIWIVGTVLVGVWLAGIDLAFAVGASILLTILGLRICLG